MDSATGAASRARAAAITAATNFPIQLRTGGVLPQMVSEFPAGAKRCPETFKVTNDIVA